MDIFDYLCTHKNKSVRKTVNIQQQVIHFRRWSRKGYAIFCSLGRCVLIRQLRKSLTEASLKKQKSISIVSLWMLKEEYNIQSDEEDLSLLDSLSWLLDMLVQPQVASDVCASNKFLLNKPENKIAG